MKYGGGKGTIVPTGDAGVPPAVKILKEVRSEVYPDKSGAVPFTGSQEVGLHAAPPIFFRDEGNFSSPASPERRGEAMSNGHRGTGAGWYTRHPAAIGIKELRIKDKRLIIIVYESKCIHTFV